MSKTTVKSSGRVTSGGDLDEAEAVKLAKAMGLPVSGMADAAIAREVWAGLVSAAMGLPEVCRAVEPWMRGYFRGAVARDTPPPPAPANVPYHP